MQELPAYRYQNLHDAKAAPAECSLVRILTKIVLASPANLCTDYLSVDHLFTEAADLVSHLPKPLSFFYQ